MKTGILTVASILVGASAMAQTNWTERFNFKGDFRVRGDFEQTENSTIGDYERNRMRLRARFQTNAKVNENTDAVLRFATGDLSEYSTTTTNQDATDYSSKKGLNLDLAYANWKPNDTAQVWIGKTPIVLYQPGNSDMIFDSDVTPEGLAYKDIWKGESVSLFWNLSYWMVDELNSNTRRVDVSAVGGDVGATFNLGTVGVTIGGGALHFANIKGAPVAPQGGTTAGAARGNTVDANNYANKYELTRGFLEVSVPAGDSPVTLYYDYVQNEDPSEENTGNLVGIKYGKLKDVGSWTISLDRRDVEADATLGIFAESDTGGGGTDVISNRIVLGYQLADATSLSLHHSTTDRRAGVESDYQRTMLDLVYNF